jgi:hypothetical protein
MICLLSRIETVWRNGYTDYDAYDAHGRYLGSFPTREAAEQAIIDNVD